MTDLHFSYGKSTVRYDPITGEFTWIVAYRKPALTGKVATHSATNGYLFIKIGGKNFSAARLAYSLTVCALPSGLEIDHINRIKTDNRISNLRLVTRKGNLENREFKPNRCGFTGVSAHKSGLFRARYKSKVRYFKTIESAAQAYVEMKTEDTSHNVPD